MNKLIFLLSIFLIAAQLNAQNSKDTLNQLDKNGKKHGYWKKYNQDVLKYEGRFEHGTPTGLFIYYYEDGSKKTELKYFNEGHEASAIMYFGNGKKMAEGQFTDKKRNGKWLTYDGHNHIISEIKYTKGVKTGRATYYYPEKGKLEEIDFIDGVEHGEYIQYFPNQTIKMKGIYKQGKYHGKFTYYYPNAQIYNTGEYNMGLRDGLWSMFDDDGKIIVKVTYKKGKVVNREVFQKDKDPETLNKEISDEEMKKKGTGKYENGINDPRYQNY